MSAFANVLIGGVFHAAVLFLVAAGLQLVFGVQKIVNLACGSFYALGAYFGVTFITYATQLGVPSWLIFPGLVLAGLVLGFIGPPIERMLRSVYGRDESFQLLLTFALVLMFQDVFRFFWGANPRSLDNAYLVYGARRVWPGSAYIQCRRRSIDLLAFAFCHVSVALQVVELPDVR